MRPSRVVAANSLASVASLLHQCLAERVPKCQSGGFTRGSKQVPFRPRITGVSQIVGVISQVPVAASSVLYQIWMSSNRASIPGAFGAVQDPTRWCSLFTHPVIYHAAKLNLTFDSCGNRDCPACVIITDSRLIDIRCLSIMLPILPVPS